MRPLAALCLLAALGLFAAMSPAQNTLRVLSSSPANNALRVSASAPWSVTFDRPVLGASLSGNVHVFGRWSGVVPGQVALDASGTRMTFSPSRPFFPGETVTVSLTRNVTALDATTLARGFVAWFWVDCAPGTGTFTQRQLIPQRSPPGTTNIITYGASGGDVDGDGAPDITTFNEISSDLRVMRNDGCGTAGPFVIQPGAGQPSPNETADFDRDGLLDLCTGNQLGFSASVFFNNGAGGFTAPVVRSTGGITHGVAALDVDADGLPDLVTTNHAVVLVFRNLGNRAFATTPTIFEAGNREDAVMACDANGDGIGDIAVGNEGGSSVAFLLGDGQGSFVLGGSRGCGGQPFQIAVGDVDGDGHCDIVTANRTSASLGVVLGDGQGNLVATTTWASGSAPVAVDLGDIDGDGDLDAVTSLYVGSAHDVLWNNGNGTYTAGPRLGATQHGSCCTIVDFDRDGLMDLISADEGADEIRIYLQDRPALSAVQPIGCAATLRTDQWAVAGYGRAARPVPSGRTTFFSVTAAPNTPFAIVLGGALQPGLPLPFGLANLDPAFSAPLVIGLFGDPRAVTDGNGERHFPLAIPQGIGGTIGAQAAVQDFAGAGLLFSNPVQLAFAP